jgi:hypothetical protein
MLFFQFIVASGVYTVTSLLFPAKETFVLPETTSVSEDNDEIEKSATA